jgi:DNA-binding NarL/FixJ family response regulator
MAISSRRRNLLNEGGRLVSDVLLVRVPQSALGTLSSDSFSHADSGREALGMLKLLRFRLLVASLDVPDMPPSELFHAARRAQAGLQCILLDERMTPEDESRVRQAGAGAFVVIHPGLRDAFVAPLTGIA